MIVVSGSGEHSFHEEGEGDAPPIFEPIFRGKLSSRAPCSPETYFSVFPVLLCQSDGQLADLGALLCVLIALQFLTVQPTQKLSRGLPADAVVAEGAGEAPLVGEEDVGGAVEEVAVQRALCGLTRSLTLSFTVHNLGSPPCPLSRLDNYQAHTITTVRDSGSQRPKACAYCSLIAARQRNRGQQPSRPKRSRFFCNLCKVHLCRNACFERYHDPNDDPFSISPYYTYTID